MRRAAAAARERCRRFFVSEHLDQALEAVELEFSDDDATYLEEPNRPHPVLGHS